MKASLVLFIYTVACTLSSYAATPNPPKPQKLTSADQVPEGLAKSDWSSIRAAYEAGRHQFFPQADGTHQAHNPGMGWQMTFDAKGFTATPNDGAWTWGLELESDADIPVCKGADEAGIPVRTNASDADRSRSGAESDSRRLPNGRAERVNVRTTLTIPRSPAITEWFVNDQRGLEQGWTLTAPAEIRLRVRGNLKPSVSPQSISFGGQLTYSGLKAWDATGKTIPTHFEATAEGFAVRYDDSAAQYPLTIDPIAQQAYLKASNTAANDWFGYSVAVSGDTVVIGAPYESSNAAGSGAAYVFVRSGSTWTQQAYLKASNTGMADQFGLSVAISGDTVVIGAWWEASNATGVNGNQADNSASSSGAAYVFVRSGSTWTQQAYLKASNTGGNDQFGYSVAVSGETVVIGARYEDSNATGVNGNQADNSAGNSGAAYVFVRSAGVWTQQAYLKASNTGNEAYFGESVAVSGDTVVIGAEREGSSATGVNGNQADNSAGNSGAAYVFVRSAGVWTQQAYLKASNTGVSDFFGKSVAVAGDTAVIGARREDSNATGVGGNGEDNSANNSGAAYVFVRSGSTWTQQAYLKASNTVADDEFGFSVAASSDTALIGTSQANTAYVFTRSGSTWTQQAFLQASNIGADQFGASVAVSGGTAVIGARWEDSSATGVNGNQSDNSASDSGAAYIFTGLGPEFAAADIAVSQTIALIDSVGSVGFGTTVAGSNTPLSFTLTNPGTAPLTSLSVTKDGANAGDFNVSALSATSIPVGAGTVTFSVTFAPTTGGAKTAAIHIASNVSGPKNPFDIALSGLALAFTNDTDSDGLNDASELQMAALGFNWQVNQSALVNTLTSNLNGAGYFSPAQVQALHIGTPLIQRDAPGQFKLTLGVEKSTTLAPGSFTPFPLTAPQTAINGAGKLEFRFTVPDNAAFFRVQAQ